MSAAAVTNALILTNLALETALRSAQYTAVVQKALAEGRDVSDEEVATARASAVQAVDALEADVPAAP